MNVLIARPDGIGDLVLALPVAAQLRELIPGVHIGLLASPVAAPLLDHHPDVDYVRAVSLQAPVRDLVKTLSGEIDAVIFLKPFRRLMWAAWLARVPIRVATGFRWQSVLANRWINEHRSGFARHESEYNVGMVKGLGLTPIEASRPRLVVTDSERAQGDRQWGGKAGRRVIIHPGGVSARRWKPEHYRDLANLLARQGYPVILTGSEAERVQFQREVLDGVSLDEGIRNVMGRLSVRELMGLIATSQVVVSGATGPAHMAAALAVPNVSLFDPRRNNLPTRWKPLGRGVLLRPDVPTCEICVGEACSYWDCMDRLTVSNVSMQVAQVIQSTAPLSILHL
ncbi:glycosyltransferase family 9 protein [Nitrospira sp. NS4]|uniref:glycosyltransferase family 9 protein n=1 Tax=Nitrospira sp. NS4 TaxID=3414498 RepID=UPI003C2E0B28